MSRTLFTIGIVCITSFFSCDSKKKHLGYTLNGKAIGIADSTYIKLSADNKILDSTLVLGESFVFSGELESPKKVYLIAAEDYKSFWLENTIVDFSAKTGEFKDASISGSRIQKVHDILFHLLNSYLINT